MNLDLTPEMQEHLRSMVLSDDEEITHLKGLRQQTLEVIAECWTEIYRIDKELLKRKNDRINLYINK